jgi:hypothetical protein
MSPDRLLSPLLARSVRIVLGVWIAASLLVIGLGELGRRAEINCSASSPDPCRHSG